MSFLIHSLFTYNTIRGFLSIYILERFMNNLKFLKPDKLNSINTSEKE